MESIASHLDAAHQSNDKSALPWNWAPTGKSMAGVVGCGRHHGTTSLIPEMSIQPQLARAVSSSRIGSDSYCEGKAAGGHGHALDLRFYPWGLKAAEQSWKATTSVNLPPFSSIHPSWLVAVAGGRLCQPLLAPYEAGAQSGTLPISNCEVQTTEGFLIILYRESKP